MKKLKWNTAIMICILMLGSSVGSESNDEKNRILTTEELLKIIILFENIMNRDYPLISDYDSLYHGEVMLEAEGETDWNYCRKLGLQPDTKPCEDALVNLWNSFGNGSPSLHLLQIKNIITDSSKASVKLFVDPHIKSCSPDKLALFEYNEINTIAVVGGKKFRTVTFHLPCNSLTTKNSKGYIYKISGNKIDDYPLTIKPPPPQK